MSVNSAYLLPKGMEDQLPPIAYHQNKIAQLILTKLHFFGYDMVFPPMLEYAKSFYQTLADNEMKSNCFEVTDIDNGKDLVLRSDITVQVARIARQRLRKQIRPLRLCYHDKIVFKQNSRSYKREYHQIGAEIFYDGKDDLSSNLEILGLLIECLQTIKLTDYKIELSFPIIIFKLLENMTSYISSYSKPKAVKDKILKALIQKDVHSLEEFAKQNHKIKSTINDLLQLINFQGSTQQAINYLITRPLAKEYKKNLLELINLVQALNKQYPKVEINFDPLELTGFSYHDGLCFNVYALGEREEIGRGGSYSIARKNQNVINNTKPDNLSKPVLLNESSTNESVTSTASVSRLEKESASGFSLYLENITSLVKINSDRGKLLLSQKQGNLADFYRNKGYRVVVWQGRTSKLADISKLAKEKNFDYYLDENEKIKKL